MRSLKALFIGVIAVMFIVGCSGNVPARNKTSDINGSFTPAQIEKAIVDAGTGQGWEMKQVRDGVITGKLITRQSYVDIRIPYTSSKYTIEYVGSKNLTVSMDRVPSDYNRWVANIDRDIQQNLAQQQALYQ
ncbi:hypothetical protein [Budvicia aquatica]|uniref:Lipoprotein n=1 Tax=Budvicia aquatica TaxID=82979 RepID=A0A2C6DI41_9GAMM|nr:hypothetical protein [Budvicia aquatica]PHI28481.1 hypothetical protein CRN84_03630 [Budvicia aquatica]GKX52372.1 lipoprotein [Budvicia aquatica]VFS46419.1 Uncharacterised protein [Budvicia aquatica]